MEVIFAKQEQGGKNGKNNFDEEYYRAKETINMETINTLSM